jgi:hypothetical protein
VSVSLVPSFSWSVHDYYVRCAAGTNALIVSMIASPGAESALLQPKISTSEPEQILALRVDENQAIVATATRGTASTEYWVRCLPHDFPHLQMSPHADAGIEPRPGYYLVGNRQTLNGAGAYAMVLNASGVPVWYFHETRGPGVLNVDSVTKGAVSFVAPGLHGAVFPYEIHQLSPWKTAYTDAPGTVFDEHELRALPNGDYLILSRPILGGVDLTGLRLPAPDGGVDTFGANSNILNCNILEVDSKGDVAWRWIGSEHLDALRETTFPVLWPEKAPDGGLVADPFHCDSIDVDPANGNLLVSARHMDSVFYVDRSTSKVLWKMGGTEYSKDHATYVRLADPYYRQHDARLQPGWAAACHGGAGQVSVFDDETARPAPARAALYSVVVGGDGGTKEDCASWDGGTAPQAILAWQYAGRTSAAATGSFRILPDGSRVIGWGIGPTPDLVFTEVDVQGDDLLDFYFTDDNSSYRAIKLPLTAFDLGVLRRTAGAASEAADDDGLGLDSGTDAETSDAGPTDAGPTDDGPSESGPTDDAADAGSSDDRND